MAHYLHVREKAIAFARSGGLVLSVRSGGHNVAGNSLCEGGLVVDLSMMKGISVDPDRRFARADAGLTLGEFDAATQAFGLATTMGVNSDTGIAGLTLGGGFGKLGRRFGLACDNLLAADLVTADGQLVRSSATENDELLWGLRGGGSNFGIVTAFEYSLHRVGPQLLAGSLVYGEAERRDALRRYYEFSHNAPDEISADAALMTSESGERLLGISVCYCGPLEQGERAIAPLRNHGKPIEEQFAAVPYLHIQSGGDNVFPRGRRYYWKAQFLQEITDAAIDSFLEAYAAAPSPTALAVLQHVGGAIARIPTTATAYGGRDALFRFQSGRIPPTMQQMSSGQGQCGQRWSPFPMAQFTRTISVRRVKFAFEQRMGQTIRSSWHSRISMTPQISFI